MKKTASATRRLASAARRLLPRARRSGALNAAGSKDQGFICAFLRGRWCTARYDACFSAVSLAVGSTTACARRLQGLPSRFEALFLLHKLMRHQPG